jgi:hypothetical protein
MIGRRSGQRAVLLAVLVDPLGAMRATVSRPRPARLLAGLGVSLLALGVCTLPRQLALLSRALPAAGDGVLDAQRNALSAGLVRLMFVDRLVPSPTLVLAAAFLVVVAEPVLMLARDRRRAILAVALLGLAPLLVERLGELAITYLLPLAASVTPGDALRVPHRFVTGPLMAWTHDAPAPTWLEVVDARVNAITLWSVGLWSVGLRTLDGGRWELWHAALPVWCLLGAGLLTWVTAPLAVAIILR